MLGATRENQHLFHYRLDGGRGVVSNTYPRHNRLGASVIGAPGVCTAGWTAPLIMGGGTEAFKAGADTDRAKRAEMASKIAISAEPITMVPVRRLLHTTTEVVLS